MTKTKESSSAVLASSQYKRHANRTTAYNKRLPGKIMQQYKTMELLHNFDPNCLPCPGLLRFNASRRARKLAGRSAFHRHSWASGTNVIKAQLAAQARQATSGSLPVVCNAAGEDTRQKASAKTRRPSWPPEKKNLSKS